MNRIPIKAKKRRRAAVEVVAPLALFVPMTRAADCPPMLNGWVPAPGCRKYHLCDAGEKASPDYNCQDGYLFDVSTTKCQQAAGVTCKALAGDPEPDAAAQSPVKEDTPADSTEVEKCGGVPVYYFVDIPNQTCYSSCQKKKDEWISEIFPKREECCEVNFQWMPLDDCLEKDLKVGYEPYVWTQPPTIGDDTPAPTDSPGIPIPSPTMPPVEISPDDPRFLFMCGTSWVDASARCHQRCPNGQDEECPGGEVCFGETSCYGGVIKITEAPTEAPVTPRPTPRTKKPNTSKPSKSPVSLSPTTAEPTQHPTTSYITHRPTRKTRKPSHTSMMSAAHTINVVGAFDHLEDATYVPTFYPTFTRMPSPSPTVSTMPTSSSNPSTAPTVLSTVEPTQPPVRVTRQPRPETPEPTPSPEDSRDFPTPAPTFQGSEKPNFVVQMIASPLTSSNMGTMTESIQDSPYVESYGLNLVPNLGTSNQVSQNSLGSLSFHNQIYGNTVEATESPMHYEEAFIGMSSSSSSISELIIPVTEDATISPKRPDLTFGLNSMLALDGADAHEQFDILLKFDFSVMDDTSKIKSATLKMFATQDCPYGGSYYSTTSINSNWESSSVTWNTAPKSLALLDSLGGVSGDHWYSVDVMSLFNLRLSSYATIRVESKTMGRCMFASMENKSTNAPYIVIEMEGPQSQIVGMSGSLNEDPPVPIELLPITSGEFAMVRASADSTIDAIRVNEKLGALPSLHISLSVSPRQVLESLIQFDLADFQQYKPKSAVILLFPEITCHSASRIAVTNTGRRWSEKEMNWANSPETEFVVGTFGSVEAGHWYGFNVIKALEWAQSKRMEWITFRLLSDGDYSCQFSSIQSGRAPKLVASF